MNYTHTNLIKTSNCLAPFPLGLGGILFCVTYLISAKNNWVLSQYIWDADYDHFYKVSGYYSKYLSVPNLLNFTQIFPTIFEDVWMWIRNQGRGTLQQLRRPALSRKSNLQPPGKLFKSQWQRCTHLLRQRLSIPRRSDGVPYHLRPRAGRKRCPWQQEKQHSLRSSATRIS